MAHLDSPDQGNRTTTSPDTPATPPANPPGPDRFVRIEFWNGKRATVVTFLNRQGFAFRKGQLLEGTAASRPYWVVRLPAGEYIYDDDGMDVKFVDDGPPVPLTPGQCRAIRLATDGVVDDVLGRPPTGFEGGGQRFLWDGLVPRHGVTLLVGATKGGKSTLLRSLMGTACNAWDASDEAGEEVRLPFLGRGVDPFHSLVVSEEPGWVWADRPAGVGVRLFEGNPITKRWPDYVRGLGRLAWEYTSDKDSLEPGLVVLDSFSRIVGVDENNAKQVTRAMAPVRELARMVGGVLVLHHLNRSGGVRGSVAIEAQVDHVLLLEAVSPDDPTDTRRVLTSAGRVPGQRPFKIEFEMRPDGTLELTGARDRKENSGAAAGRPSFFAPPKPGV